MLCIRHQLRPYEVKDALFHLLKQGREHLAVMNIGRLNNRPQHKLFRSQAVKETISKKAFPFTLYKIAALRICCTFFYFSFF